jgi:hypothetical protein
MSKATVFSAAQYGLADCANATGLLVGSVTFTGTSDTAEAPDHIGCVVGFSVYNQRKDVSIDGIIKTKGTGLGGDIGTVLTIAEATNNSRTKLGEALDVTPDANAAFIMTGNTISPTATGFEGGGITGVYHPFVSTNSPASLT